MEYAYAVLLLSETGSELNERNLRAVLEAANCDVSESRVKALVAALEGVDVGSAGSGAVASAVDDEESDRQSPGEPGAETSETGADGDESG